MSEQLYLFDRAIEAEVQGSVVGLDEAGRGPLAGPVVAAAVRLDLTHVLPKLNDSKKLSPAVREMLYQRINAEASAAWAVGVASVEEIERLNILQASLLAMQRALDGLQAGWALALVDGNQFLPSLERARQRTLVHGDGRSASIAAASVMAKVTRDRMMLAFHAQHPGWGFDCHKGYGTPLHLERIRQIGLSPLHRRSFCQGFGAQTCLELQHTEDIHDA